MGLKSWLKKKAKKVLRAVETVVAAAVGSSVGGMIGGAIGSLVGLDLATSIVIGLIGGAVAAGGAAAAGGIVAGLEAAANLFRWAYERIGSFAFGSGGILGRLFSPLFCPTGMAFFLFTEGVNRYRNLVFTPQKMDAFTQERMRQLFPNMRLDEIKLYEGADVFPSWAAAITFRKTIFIRSQVRTCDYSENKVLVHELVHVKQYHQLGFYQFACRYADEVLRGAPGKVLPPQNPNPLLLHGESLEDEAYIFEEQNRRTLYQDLVKHCPLGVSGGGP
jgi:hypothetical protein